MEKLREKVLLRREEETLLITLYAKTLAAPQGILEDPAAWKLLDQIEYDFSKLRVPNGTRATIVLRAKKIDSVVRGFLARHPDGVVLHLGCGLDTRFNRVDNGLVTWVDLDLPAVISLRQKLFPPTPRYQMLAASAADLNWTDQVQAGGKALLVAAEGLFMYLHEADVRGLIGKLCSAFPGCELVFDAFSELTARRVGANPALKKTGAAVHWGIDDALQIESWAPGLRLEEEWYFSRSEDIARMPFGFRLMNNLNLKAGLSKRLLLLKTVLLHR